MNDYSLIQRCSFSSYTNKLSLDLIVVAYWHKRPLVDTSLHSGTISLLDSNQVCYFYLLILQAILLFSCSASLMSYFSSHLFEQQMFATGVTISAVSLNVGPLFKPKDCYITH